MQKNLLIVFAKNKMLGRVKTRLAKSIGDQSAFEVYEKLFEITERESCAVKNAAVHVYFSNEIDAHAWGNLPKFVQEGETLGDRMKTAFTEGFKKGYQNIIGIGADLPEMNASIIENAFVALTDNDFVFGPAEDGGYYLVGISGDKGLYVFDDKPWSTPELMEITRKEINDKWDALHLLEVLNDIDTIDDLERSCIAEQFEAFIAKGKLG